MKPAHPVSALAVVVAVVVIDVLAAAEVRGKEGEVVAPLVGAVAVVTATVTVVATKYS
jgi:hypothetical protein